MIMEESAHFTSRHITESLDGGAFAFKFIVHVEWQRTKLPKWMAPSTAAPSHFGELVRDMRAFFARHQGGDEPRSE